MVSPEKIAVNIIKPMLFLICIFKPLIVIFNGIASFIFKIFKVPQTRNDIITYDDIFAVVDAGC